MCSTMKKLIYLCFYFRIIKTDFCNATGQNILFFLFVDSLDLFVSFCIYNMRIILLSKSFWENTKEVKCSSGTS